MKKRLIFKSLIMAAVAVAAVSCNDDDAYLGGVDTGRLDVPDGSVVTITDHNGKRHITNVELYTTATNTLNANLSTALGSDCTVNFSYDPASVEAYNSANGTSYTALPATMFSFANGGNATISAGTTQGSVSYTITSDGSLSADKTYAAVVKISANGAQVSPDNNSHLIVISDFSSLKDCYKTYTDEQGNVKPGIKIFSVMEVNDTNPLNNLRYTLKNSGKYMVDALVMFSGNINYNAETGRVYFYPNDNIQAILDNREKYLKPLKDRGMKVIMGVMCNHDRACISNLAPETARLFAQELKAVCDAYDLDGIFWDDEYCSPITPPPAGFENRNETAWSRLAYEVWKLQPERWNIAYGYSMTGSAVEIDGVEPGKFISYCLPDYSSSYTTSWLGNYPGMTVSQLGGCSMEFAQGRWYASESTLRSMRDEGFGAMMVFAMDPFRTNASGQEDAMGKLAKAFYDDEVVVDPTTYPKDWK